MVHIVKRKGHKEPFDSRKIYASVYAAARNAHLSELESEKIAEATASALEKWIAKRALVSSQDIFEQTVRVLSELHPDVAFLYKTHRDLA